MSSNIRQPLEACHACGNPIYPGEMVYRMMASGYIICGNVDCLATYVRAQKMTIDNALNEEKEGAV